MRGGSLFPSYGPGSSSSRPFRLCHPSQFDRATGIPRVEWHLRRASQLPTLSCESPASSPVGQGSITPPRPPRHNPPTAAPVGGANPQRFGVGQRDL